jgi:outer membrane receptor protein involved in Fe transport
LNWEIGDSIRLNFAIDNATDASYEEAIGFPAIGRRTRISVQKTFGEGRR